MLDSVMLKSPGVSNVYRNLDDSVSIFNKQSPSKEFISINFDKLKWYPEDKILYGKLSELPSMENLGNPGFVETRNEVHIISNVTGNIAVFHFDNVIHDNAALLQKIKKSQNHKCYVSFRIVEIRSSGEIPRGKLKNAKGIMLIIDRDLGND